VLVKHPQALVQAPKLPNGETQLFSLPLSISYLETKIHA